MFATARFTQCIAQGYALANKNTTEQRRGWCTQLLLVLSPLFFCGVMTCFQHLVNHTFAASGLFEVSPGSVVWLCFLGTLSGIATICRISGRSHLIENYSAPVCAVTVLCCGSTQRPKLPRTIVNDVQIVRLQRYNRYSKNVLQKCMKYDSSRTVFLY